MRVRAGRLDEAVALGHLKGTCVEGGVGVARVVDLEGLDGGRIGEKIRDVVGAAEGVGVDDPASRGPDAGEVFGGVDRCYIGVGEEKVLAEAVGEELRALGEGLPAGKDREADAVALGLGGTVAAEEELDLVGPGRIPGAGDVGVHEMIGDHDGVIARSLAGTRHIGPRGEAAGAGLGGVEVELDEETSPLGDSIHGRTLYIGRGALAKRGEGLLAGRGTGLSSRRPIMARSGSRRADPELS